MKTYDDKNKARLYGKPIDLCIGRRITAVEVLQEDTELRITFDDGRTLVLRDNWQCCEERHMTYDAVELQCMVGTRLLGIEVRAAPPASDDAEGLHEIQFLDLRTSGGVVSIANHNIHNGYYGGFEIVADILEPDGRQLRLPHT